MADGELTLQITKFLPDLDKKFKKKQKEKSMIYALKYN